MRSIARKAAQRPKVNHRPTHPRVEHVEGLVEALVALCDDRDILNAADRAITHINCVRHRLESELRANMISRTEFLDAFGDLDRLERRVGDKLSSRGLRLGQHIIPEVQRCYRAAEFV